MHAGPGPNGGARPELKLPAPAPITTGATARAVKTLPILASAACALLLAAAPASADLYASSITAPTSDPTFWVYNGDAPMQELISGTITDVSSSPSDLPTTNQAQCYTGIAQPPVAPSPVASFTGPTVLINGATHEYGWGAQSSISGLKGEACTLVLVPSDVAGSFPFSSIVFEGSRGSSRAGRSSTPRPACRARRT